MTTEELKSILLTMNVPTQRLDISHNHNVLWMLRNLGIWNSTHRDFDKVYEALKEIANKK